MTEPDIAFLSIAELGAKLRSKAVSPVELATHFLDRLEKHGPGLGALVTLTRERALAEAREAEKELRSGKVRGPLHGIPYGLKDLVATKGIPTTWGAEPYRNQVFDFDATAATKLREAGAVLVAKLSMVELAGGLGYNNADASFTGPGRTPWNRDFWSGGSSSGPGSAVAAGLVPFAIGSETSGSILTPSAFCGVSGHRPTYGLVSRHGAMPLAFTLDKLGPMARSAADCALVLAAIAGKDPKDPQTAGRSFTPEAPRTRYRIGVLKGTFEKAQPEVAAAFQESLKVLATFCDVVPDVELPDLPYGPVVGTLVGAEGAAIFRELIESGKTRLLRAANDKWGGFAPSMTLAVDYLDALRAKARIARDVGALAAKFDALVAPTRASLAYPIGVDFDKAYPGVSGGPPVIAAGTIAGLPALSVPNGFAPNGLPTGLAFLGGGFRDGRLLALGARYQSVTDFHRKRPPSY